MGRRNGFDESRFGPPPMPEVVPNTKRTTRTHLNGPISQYLARTKKTPVQFEQALEAGEPNAVTLFAAEVVFGEVQRLADKLERLDAGTKPF